MSTGSTQPGFTNISHYRFIEITWYTKLWYTLGLQSLLVVPFFAVVQ